MRRESARTPTRPPDHAAEFGKGGLPPADADGRLDAPAFHRNHGPIWSVLSRRLRETGLVVSERQGRTVQYRIVLSRLYGLGYELVARIVR